MVSSTEPPISSRFFRHDVRPEWLTAEREEVLAHLRTDRRAVHVGYTDAPFAVTKIAPNSLLHARIAAVATEIFGVDIDQPGIEKLGAIVPGRCIRADVPDPEVAHDAQASGPDLIFASHVVEYIDNQVRGLAGLGTIAGRTDATIVVSGPNTFATRNDIQSWFNMEVMHRDQRRVFSSITLETAARAAGPETVSRKGYRIAQGGSLSWRVLDRMSRAMARRGPLTADGPLFELVCAKLTRSAYLSVLAA